MYLISEFAKKVGVSRSTLLYYEKIGLICSQRSENGYRCYDELAIQQFYFFQELQAAGLTLKECKEFLNGKLDKRRLEKRKHILEAEILKKQQASELLSALLGNASLRSWHVKSEKIAPTVHLNWLKQQGFDEKQALYLKWISKDMNNHDQYMQEFLTLFKPLDRWGPGSDEETLKALSFITDAPQLILDVGCGKGFSTRLLAKNTTAHIHAVDNAEEALQQLRSYLDNERLSHRVTLTNASMTELPFTANSFDLIWSEGAAYIMGVENALNTWKKLLKPNGYMVFSDLVWLTDHPSSEVMNFWKEEYADMQSIANRKKQIKEAGFTLIADHTFSEQSWKNYYLPLKQRVNEVRTENPASLVIEDLEKEISLYENHLNQFGYHIFVLKNSG